MRSFILWPRVIRSISSWPSVSSAFRLSARRQRAIDYLEYEEIDSILKAIDRTTAARQPRLCSAGDDVQHRRPRPGDRRSARLRSPTDQTVSGETVWQRKKGALLPAWPQTAAVLRAFCKQRNLDSAAGSSRVPEPPRQPLTRFGIRHILGQCLARACADAPNLRKKRLHPHSIRHSTAVALLKSGVDLSTISHLLGHASPTTTNRYAKVDLEMKRKAIAKVKPVSRRSRTPWSKDSTILDWLESL